MYLNRHIYKLVAIHLDGLSMNLADANYERHVAKPLVGFVSCYVTLPSDGFGITLTSEYFCVTG